MLNNRATRTDKSIQNMCGILILSSLFDTHVDIGTAGHYELLPVPWDPCEFARKASGLVSFGSWRAYQLSHPLFTGPISSIDTDLLHMKTGIQAWIKPRKELLEVALMLSEIKLPHRIRLKAQRDLNFMSYHTRPDIVFDWETSSNDDTAISAFEQEVLNCAKKIL